MPEIKVQDDISAIKGYLKKSDKVLIQQMLNGLDVMNDLPGSRRNVKTITQLNKMTVDPGVRPLNTGVKEAKGEAVAFMPGDDENDPGEIMRYFGLLSQVDMVVPFVYNKEVRPKSRNLISVVFRSLVNITFGVNFNYTNGTVLYRRAILANALNRSAGFFFQTENVVRAVWSGYLFAEVPYRLAVRAGGESKALSLRSLRQVAGDYLSLIKEIYFSPEKKADRKPAPGTVSDLRRNETIESGLGKPGKYSRE